MKRKKLFVHRSSSFEQKQGAMSRSTTPIELCSPSSNSSTDDSLIDVNAILTPEQDKKKYGSHMRFYFLANKVKQKVTNVTKITKSDIEQSSNVIDKNILNKVLPNINWIIDRMYMHLSTNDDNVQNIINQYRNIFKSIISFQFVTGHEFRLPIFTLGSPEYDKKYPIYCNCADNKEFKFIIVDTESTRNMISDLLLVLHARSDVGDDKFKLVCGEILQRRGKKDYTVNVFMLIKIIYSTVTTEFNMNDLIKNILKSDLNYDSGWIRHIIINDNEISKFVDWLVKY